MKKKLIPIAIYVGIFVVLNVGMFFLLKMTQPKSAVLDAALHGDSTAVEGDSTLALNEEEFDESSDQGEVAETENALTENEATESASDSTALKTSSDEMKSEQTTANLADSSPEKMEIDGEDAGLEGELASDDTSNYVDPATTLNETPKSTAEISKLAKLLEGMKPNEAAVIAERLPTETIVQLVMRMKSRNGAKMMASLPVPVAASVATRMAELSGVKSPS